MTSSYRMQATRRVEIVLVNGLTEGVWLLTTTDPYRTAVVVSVHVFWSGTHRDWSHHWHHRHHRPIRLSWSRAYTWLSSVCAHAFSRLTASVGGHGSRRRWKYVWIGLNSNPNLFANSIKTHNVNSNNFASSNISKLYACSTVKSTVVHSGHLFPKPSHNTTVLKCCVVAIFHNTTI